MYLDLAILRELVVDVVLLRLLVDAGDEEDPALDAPLRTRLTHLVTVNTLVIALKVDYIEGATWAIMGTKTYWTE